MTRGATLDELYRTADSSDRGRADRLAFVIAAGGEVHDGESR